MQVPERFNAVRSIVDGWAAGGARRPRGAVARRRRRGGRPGHDRRPGERLAARRAGAARARRRQGRPRVRDAAAGPRVVCGAAGLHADRRGADAGPEPADAQGHRLPVHERRGGRGGHRRRRRRQGRRGRRRSASYGCASATTSPTAGFEFAQALDDAGDGEMPADPTSRDDPLLLYFTSGTVSYPKMVQHAALLRARPRRDRALLARPAARGPALDGDRHRLGEGRVGRTVRAVARARVHRPGRARAPRRRHDLSDPGPPPDHLVLRAADALPAARPG